MADTMSYIRSFIEAVYPEAPDLALASFNERKCLIDATERIRELDREAATLRRHPSGDSSTLAASGKNSVVMAAYGSTASAGEGGALAAAWWDNTAQRPRIAVAYVGENGIQANVAYRVNERGEFVEGCGERTYTCPECAEREAKEDEASLPVWSTTETSMAEHLLERFPDLPIPVQSFIRSQARSLSEETAK